MNGLPYYKAYPRDFFEGTIGIDFEIKAAYRLLLDLIYMHGGKLVDDSRFIAGHLGCSVKKWNSLRAAIIATGKISVSGGYLGNLRADKELDSLKSYQGKQRENAAKPRKNNTLTPAVAKPSPSHTEPEPDTVKEEGGGGVRERARDDAPSGDLVAQLIHALGFDRGGVIPSYWIAPDAHLIAARWRTDLGLTEDEILQVARSNAIQHGEPARGPKTLNRAMADFAAAKAAPPLTPTQPAHRGQTHDRPSERRAFDRAINTLADGLTAGTVQLDTASRDPFARRG